MAAMKLVLDRIVPASAFDVSRSGGAGVPQISINISTLGAPSVDTVEEYNNNEDVTDVEVKEYDDTQ